MHARSEFCAGQVRALGNKIALDEHAGGERARRSGSQHVVPERARSFRGSTVLGTSQHHHVHQNYFIVQKTSTLPSILSCRNLRPAQPRRPARHGPDQPFLSFFATEEQQGRRWAGTKGETTAAKLWVGSVTRVWVKTPVFLLGFWVPLGRAFAPGLRFGVQGVVVGIKQLRLGSFVGLESRSSVQVSALA